MARKLPDARARAATYHSQPRRRRNRRRRGIRRIILQQEEEEEEEEKEGEHATTTSSLAREKTNARRSSTRRDLYLANTRLPAAEILHLTRAILSDDTRQISFRSTTSPIPNNIVER